LEESGRTFRNGDIVDALWIKIQMLRFVILLNV